jgi:hypothetical protein
MKMFPHTMKLKRKEKRRKGEREKIYTKRPIKGFQEDEARRFYW